ncbi:hypothetical protein [Streptomyces sp. NPDC005004]
MTIDQWLLDGLEGSAEAATHRAADPGQAPQEIGAEIAYSTVWDPVHRRRQEIAEPPGRNPSRGS